jgi:hypothetical protein
MIRLKRTKAQSNESGIRDIFPRMNILSFELIFVFSYFGDFVMGLFYLMRYMPRGKEGKE